MKKILVLFMVLTAFFISACGSNEEKKPEVQPTAKAETALPADINTRIAEAVNAAGANTSGAVDAICIMAKNDAKSITEDQTKEALAFISKNYPKYFLDNATMEKTMYYGALLNYAFKDDDPRSRVGSNAVKAVKYVYRGAEKASDESTKNALNKIKKELTKI